MKRLPILFFILPLYLFGGIGAESNALIDSLQKTIATTESQFEKVDIYNQIAFQYLFIQ